MKPRRQPFRPAAFDGGGKLAQDHVLAGEECKVRKHLSRPKRTISQVRKTVGFLGRVDAVRGVTAQQ